MQQLTNSQYNTETDIYLTSISKALCPHLFAQMLIETVKVKSRTDVNERETRYTNKVKTNKRHSSLIPQHISRVVWNWI
jgi:hypothetical protein